MDLFLDAIDYVPDRERLVKKAGMEIDSDEAEEFLELLDNVAAHAKPKAFMTSASVQLGEAPALRLNNIDFSGTILFDNIKEVSEVWPYTATCGVEMYDFVMAIPDPFERFWGEIVLEDALMTADKALQAAFARDIYGEKTAAIAPGSLPEWPLEQQVPLFRLLGDGAKKAGVTLTDTLLMLPNKSVSGIRFPNEHGYVSCRLCPRNACPNRRAEYEPETSLMGT